MVKLNELLSYLEELWPLQSADEWDRPGLGVGSRDSDISSVLLSVDVTKAVVEEAIANGCNLIVSHHPLLLRGINEVTEESLKGQVVSLAIRHNIAIYSAHTNADKAEIGTARALATLYGLHNLEVLDPESGHGLIGTLSEPESLVSFATRVAKLLPAVVAGVKVAGDPNKQVHRVALSPGAGDAHLGKAMAAQVDLFMTSDLRHHPAQDFLETPGHQTALIDVSHWASEYALLPLAANTMSQRFSGLEVIVSEIRTDPWDFAVMQ